MNPMRNVDVRMMTIMMMMICTAIWWWSAQVLRIVKRIPNR